MFSLIIIIYLSFISLGLPDSLLGSAWPVMQLELGAQLSDAGIITMIISSGTVVSGLLAERINKKLGTGLTTAVSVLTTAVAIFGFSISGSLFELCLWAIPYGLGAGAVDAALNNYVALHYESKHMSWLHCFWGIGATAGPYIMSLCLTYGLSWNNGYFVISVLQIILTAVLFTTLPMWKKQGGAEETKQNTAPLPLTKAIRISGVPYVLLAFFAYCALEQTTGIWASSYLVSHKSISPELAASFASLFFLGITFGRFVCGFIANRLGDTQLIRGGTLVAIFGILLVLVPFGSYLSLLGLIVIGIGCAPIYPSVIHSTPENFGAENSQAIIGIQMAAAYAGTTLMPPLFGFLASLTSIALYPVYLLILGIAILISYERLLKLKKSL